MKGNGKGVAFTATYRQKHMLFAQFYILSFPPASQPDAHFSSSFNLWEKLSPWKLYTLILPFHLIRKREG